MEQDAASLSPLAQRVLSALQEGAEALAALSDTQTVFDLAEALATLSVESAARVVAALPFASAVEIFDERAFTSRGEVLQSLDLELATGLTEAMSADERADLFEQLPNSFAEVLRPRLSREVAQNLATLLRYPAESAGGIMTTEFVSLRPTLTVGEAISHIREVAGSMETIYYAYLVDGATGVLEGVASLRELIMARPEQPLREVVFPEPKTVRVDTDQEEAARLLTRYKLLALPVLNAKKQIVGIVTVDDALNTMTQEHSEDLQKVGGMAALDDPYLRAPFFAMVRARAGWLAVLLLGEMLTTSAMGRYEDDIERATVLTLFLPLIISSGGNSGSQATTLVIRAMTAGELHAGSWWRVAWRELGAGLSLGFILAVLGLLRVLLGEWLFGDYGEHFFLVGLTVACSLVGVVLLGTMAGSTLPFLLRRFGFDPASASAPFVATLVDVSGLLIYFSVAKIILQGTLL